MSHEDAARESGADDCLESGTPAAAEASAETLETAACRRARGLTTGDLARKCDTTLRTVRFYEEAGILCPETRSEGGHRVFGTEDLSKLQLVMDLREAGLSLQDIKDLFELKEKHPTPEAASAAMQEALEGQIEEMQRKIATLRKLREELAQTVAIIQECRTCDSAEFPKRCGDCDVVDRPELPRALRLLWGLF